MMKVLVVDDEAPARERLRSMLKAFENCDVCGEAANGEEALSVASEQQPDVMLMDIRMPGLNGVDAFRQMRQHGTATRVILMSAFGVEELKHQALDEGAIAFLDKRVIVL